MVTERPALAPAPENGATEQVQEVLKATPKPKQAEPQVEDVTTTEEPEAEQAEVTEEEAQPLTLPEGWEEIEDAKGRIKAAQDEGYNKAKSHLSRAHNATLAELEETHQEEVRSSQQRAIGSQMVQQFAEAIGNLDTDDPDSVKTITKLLHANESWARVFLGNQVRDSQANLVNLVTSNERWVDGIQGEAADEFNATIKELSLKLRSRVARADTAEEVQKAYAGALNSYLEERDKLRDPTIIAAAIAKEGKRLESAARKAAGLTEKAEQREAKAPPAKPTGAAGTGGFKSIREAQVAHAEGRISNDEMRRIRASNLPKS